jgi:flagellar hook-associated protein 1 FlgK
VNADNLAARDSVSGVNLDEEAANMLRYQQAYQAAAQIISVANDLFNSLISAVRR